MNTYTVHRFSPDIIFQAAWLYYRFNLSHRDIEDLLAERGIVVSYETIRLWCIKFGAILLRRWLRSHGSEPGKIVTDKLCSYGVAHLELNSETIHSTEPYQNNRAEQSHEATRVRERVTQRFKSTGQGQTFLGSHAAVSNLFNFGRHLVSAEYYRDFRGSSFTEWSRAVA
jgi:transposase-like protein